MRIKAVLAGMIVLALNGCGQPEQQAAMSLPPTEVAVVTLQTEPVTLVTELPGRTTDFRQAEIRPQVTGILQKRLFTEGEHVTAGQALYQIDPALYQAALNSARGNLAGAKATQHNANLTVNRLKGLVNSKVASQQDFDNSEAALLLANAAVTAAEAAVETARINLEYTTIKSPISGQISRSYVTEGALLAASQTQALATVRQLDPIYVDLTQSNTELMQLRRKFSGGEVERQEKITVTLLLDGDSEYEHQGTLQFSEVNVDPSTGMVTLRAIFPNKEGYLLPGMFVRAKVEHAVLPNAVLVPQAAVSRTSRGEAAVMLVNSSNQVEYRIIQTGQAIGTKWLVTSGLSAGEKVIVAGLQKVQPGATVRTVNADENSALQTQ